jgi:RluA family pseudouridine synthase
MLTFTATESDHGRSVESFLLNLLPSASAGYRHKLIRAGHLTVNGQATTAAALLRLGDSLALKESAKTGELLSARPPAVDILYEDDLLLVINKEPGLPVHKAAEDGGRNLVAVAEAYMAERGTPVKLRPVNRLDSGTSGATLLAKSATSAGMFGRFVKEEGLGKIYLAVTTGQLPPSGSITVPLEGKEADTGYRLLAAGPAGSLAAVFPRTGRTHQIRKHLSMIGHPILGDRRYGGPPLPGYPGHGLHAFAVAFRHAGRGEELTILAPLPAGLLRLGGQLAGSAWAEIFLALPALALTDIYRSTAPDQPASAAE